MRQHRTKLLGLGLAALAALAVALAFATGSRAASGNICKVNSGTPPTTQASCVTETLAPRIISTAGDSAVSFTKFHNEAGTAGSGATATHVMLKVSFPGVGAVVDSVTLWVAKPGSMTYTRVANPSCTSPGPLTQLSVSCSVGTISADGRAKMIVGFHGTAAGGRVTGEATYGEGGGGPSNPPNDDQINWDNLYIGSSPDGATGVGGCFQSGGTPTGGSLSSNSLNGQSTAATVVQTNDPSLPCTYLDAGVRPSSDGTGSSLPMSFVDFPTLSGTGFATVTITFPSTYKVTNKTVVQEDTNFAVPYFTTFITLASCDKKGNIVVDNKTTFVGTPPQGETNTSAPRFYDACILNRLPNTNQVVLNVLANPLDFTGRGG